MTALSVTPNARPSFSVARGRYDVKRDATDGQRHGDLQAEVAQLPTAGAKNENRQRTADQFQRDDRVEAPVIENQRRLAPDQAADTDRRERAEADQVDHQQFRAR